MISAWWIIPVLMVGAAIGFVAHSLCVTAQDN